jgi:DNA polymerase III alpha subunit (gram-positive type)
MSESTQSQPFVHLRVHSEYSVVDGTVRIPELIERVAQFGQPAIALTDLSNVFGLIKFYKAARSADPLAYDLTGSFTALGTLKKAFDMVLFLTKVKQKC